MSEERIDALVLAARFDSAALERSTREVVDHVRRAAQQVSSVSFKSIGGIRFLLFCPL